jgi:hypothetical protein
MFGFAHGENSLYTVTSIESANPTTCKSLERHGGALLVLSNGSHQQVVDPGRLWNNFPNGCKKGLQLVDTKRLVEKDASRGVRLPMAVAGSPDDPCSRQGLKCTHR